MSGRRAVVATLALGVILLLPAAPAAATPVVDAGTEIRLRTPTHDTGAHPVLRWTAVDGATRYLVVVQTPKGEPFWTWQGPERKVRLGGGPLDADGDTAGARLESRKRWFVVAFDAEGAVVGSSARRPIAP